MGVWTTGKGRIFIWRPDREKDGISYSRLTNEPYDGAVLNFFPNGQLDYKEVSKGKKRVSG